MPSKARRAASRQARLSRKKRRGKGRPQEFAPEPTSPAEIAVEDPVVEVTEEETLQPEVTPQSVRTVSATAPRPHSQRRRRQQHAAASEETATYRYLGAELRQIGLIAAVITVILVSLTFVLG